MSGQNQNSVPTGSGCWQAEAAAKEDKPKNGLPGLKHWQYDLIAGLQVALIGLPLSLGIALASGAPPIAGVISAIIAGFAFPFLGGAHIAISGPAAGLAPALLSGMLSLGHGDLATGYPLVLVAICLTGAVQVMLSAHNVGRFAMYFPMSVLQGMLAAIGILIILQQIPAFLGHLTPPARSIPEVILLIPDQVMGMNIQTFAVGVIALALLFALNSALVKKQPWARNIPAPLLVVFMGGVAGWVLHFPKESLVYVPYDVLAHGIHFPNFIDVWQRSELWLPLLTTVVTLTLINGVETMATINAIDKIDPFQRKSDPNVTLRTIGISNMLSGLAGGLTIFPGGIKSTANMIAGGRTLWANFYYAAFMALFVWFGPDLINRIPLTVLAAILIFIGWKLCAPAVFSRIWAIGKEQILIAVVCVIITLLSSNLLFGVALGVATKILLLCRDLVIALIYDSRFRAVTHDSFFACLIASIKELFRDPVIRIGDGRVTSEILPVVSAPGGYMKHPYKIYLSSISCMNVMKLDARLKVFLDHGPMRHNFMLILRGHLVDHTAMEYLHHFRNECLQEGHDCVIVGNENFMPHSSHALAYRVNQIHDSMAYV